MLDLIKPLVVRNASKIVLAVADGLGGLPVEPGGPTELEAASTPNLDALVRDNVCGLSLPVRPGITPGSGPGHLGLFGYDPLQHQIGRGVLEALGIDFDLGPADVAARGNFCTVDAEGRVIDRRAGRIANEPARAAVAKLKQIRLPGAEVFVEHVREYRFVVVLRGDPAGAAVTDTDPGREGVRPLPPRAGNPESEPTARLLEQFIAAAAKLLQDEPQANMVTLRGIARRPPIPSMTEAYGLNAAALAIYPMYRGLARLVGMTILEPGQNWAEQVAALRRHWQEFDFFFLHYKYTDAAGEDGDFRRKVTRIEEFDAQFPKIVELGPDVLIVTGDHSTPAALRNHSWHPVPVLLASRACRPDLVESFGERPCLAGGLGQLEAKYLLPLAMAHALRLAKFGA